MAENGLGADAIDADPTILRHPDAREKRRNRAGQAGGASKAWINGAFAPRTIGMLESPAYRVISLAAHRILARLEIEFADHKRNPMENGNLPCTYDDFEAYGINRHMIRPAINELVALGFIRVTRKGSAGNAEFRQSTLFLVTYLPAGSNQVVEDGWRRIQTIEEADALAEAARAKKPDAKASEFGRRGGRAMWSKKHKSSDGNCTDVRAETALSPSDGNCTDGPKKLSAETAPPSKVSRGGVSRSRGLPRRRTCG
jgi:hypothetical protein